MAEGDSEGKSTGARSATPDVFISYASQDAALADAVVAALERQGLKCWIAPRDVEPGALYADEIIGAINGAKVLVLVLSKDAIASPHVGKEVERSASKRKPIITLRTDAGQLTPALEYFLSEGHWVDLEREGSEAAFGKLADAIRRKLVPASAAAAGAPPAQRLADIPATTQRKSWIVTAVLILALGAIAFLYVERFGLNKRAERVEPPTAAMLKPAPDAPTFHPPPHSIAVLPFVNMSGDPKQDYFSDGISEEILNSLSRLNELQVVARTSSFSFKGQNSDVSTIAHKLNVGTILEGSVRRAGNTVRITVQLINGVSGFHIWSQTYDRHMTDILKVQNEVASSVARELEVRLIDEEIDKIEVGGTKIPEAYDAYLHGVRLLNRTEAETDYRAALAAFDHAIALDPNYPAAYAMRASALSSIAFATDNLSTQIAAREQALAAAQRAVALAPEFGEAHLALAVIRAGGFLDYRGAAPEYGRALALAPGNANVQRTFAFFAALMGHFDQAVIAAQRAVTLDSQNFKTYVVLAKVFYLARRFVDSEAAVKDAQALNPGSHDVEMILVLTRLALGEIEQARQLCESLATPLDDDNRHQCLALVYHALGRQPDAERALAQYKALDGDTSAYEYAEIYAQWGDKAEALKWLAKAQRLRLPALGVLRVDWQLDPIRNEPEFKVIETSMNFPP